MKKIIYFEKEIDFPSMIGEISSISIDSSLKFIDESNVEGSLNVFGTYKMTEASTLEEEFKYDLPVDISLTERVDYKDAKISIDDFHYEIKNDDILKCNIDILIDAVEEIVIEEENEVKLTENIEELHEVVEKEEKEEARCLNKIEEKNTEKEVCDNLVRECDGDKKETKELDKEEYDTTKTENIEVKEEVSEEKIKNISSFFEVLNDTEETFATYSVYILRKEDTIETIMDKYNITKEQLSNYNDLDNLEIGSKVVIPQSLNE